MHTHLEYTKWHLSPSSCLPTMDMGRKLGVGCALLVEGEFGPHLTQCFLSRVLLSDSLSKIVEAGQLITWLS